jgi:hypothetical protein
MTLGIALILVVAFGYASNWLNWRFLNHPIIRLSYYAGTLVHECSHAIVCLLTGARIQKFKVFSREPQVVHGPSKIPFVGGALISTAPLFGGLLFLWLTNQYLLGGAFSLGQTESILGAASGADWLRPVTDALGLLAQLRPFEWQSWLVVFLALNAGAMLGPSIQDLRNMWVILLILCFVTIPPLASASHAALGLIVMNIMLQCTIILTTLGISGISRWKNRRE